MTIEAAPTLKYRLPKATKQREIDLRILAEQAIGIYLRDAVTENERTTRAGILHRAISSRFVQLGRK
jgi:hypothetical protein